ncbi:TPA: hypothetical protein ACX6PM_003001 [Photobacterium damselae]
MSIEIQHDRNTGKTEVKYSKHVINTIATSLIISGFVSMSSPWWLGLVIAGLNQLSVPVAEDSQWLISGIQIVVGISLLLFKYLGLDKWEKQRAMDLATISNEKVDIELVRKYFNNLLDDHSYYSSADSMFYHSYSCFSKPESHLQFKKVQEAFDRYAESAKKLHNFVSYNFLVYPSNQFNVQDYRYCMAPHLNEDRDLVFPSEEKSRQYRALSKELSSNASEAKELFNDFIALLKREDLL